VVDERAFVSLGYYLSLANKSNKTSQVLGYIGFELVVHLYIVDKAGFWVPNTIAREDYIAGLISRSIPNEGPTEVRDRLPRLTKASFEISGTRRKSSRHGPLMAVSRTSISLI
jgi:hypothetical protein